MEKNWKVLGEEISVLSNNDTIISCAVEGERRHSIVISNVG